MEWSDSWGGGSGEKTLQNVAGRVIAARLLCYAVMNEQMTTSQTPQAGQIPAAITPMTAQTSQTASIVDAAAAPIAATLRHTRRRPEVLAPAGNLRSLKTAVDFGADAVYCGG